MERTKTFVNGGRVYPADINAIEDRAAEMLEGTAAAIPSSHYAGRYYRAIDTGDLYLDNGTTWKKIAGKEAIETENIKTEAITDAKVIKGRALVGTENSYGIAVERTSGTEYEPSATRMTFVRLVVQKINATNNIVYEVSVGGIGLGTVRSPSVAPTVTLADGFLVPPKVKYKVTITGESIMSTFYLTL